MGAAAILLAARCLVPAADAVFSGPQPGEKTTPFKLTTVNAAPGASTGQERDPITENAGQPTALVFVHGIERSLVPLLRVIDQYGAMRTNQLKTEVVFLAADRLEGERRVKAANGSLKLQSRVGLSLDGAEGPGNYGLNKQCLMTVLAARSNVVTANFALVQPGFSDAPKIIAALAKVCGDTNPPTAEDLTRLQVARTGGDRMNMNRGSGDKPKEDFPGAVPTDGQLQSMLRHFIRPTNDNATVDQILKEVKSYIKDSPDLQKQARDGWTRVLHFGDRYGTDYSRKVGREFHEQLKAQVK